MGKTHIGELFFRERALKLPSPLPGRFQFVISERSLRLLITGLIILFLVFEPLGLVGIWHRIQTYFLLWPFKHRPVAGARK